MTRELSMFDSGFKVNQRTRQEILRRLFAHVCFQQSILEHFEAAAANEVSSVFSLYINCQALKSSMPKNRVAVDLYELCL
jgi:hypothetical protein